MMARPRTAVLISGRGSNMGALTEAARDPNYPAVISLVIADRADAPGLDRAARAGIDAHVVARDDFTDRAAFEAALDRVLRRHGVDIIACAGFMRILSADFLKGWPERIINIHPSLLPAYKGLNTHARAIADGARTHGCSVHFVTPELDGGPVIARKTVPVLPGDTPESLAARVLIQEHLLYPQALAAVARGDVRFSSPSADNHATTA